MPRARTLLPAVVMPLLLFAVLARGAAGGGFRWDAALLRLAEDWYHVDPAVEISRAAARATTVLVAAVGVATLAVLITWRRLRESAFWALTLVGVIALEGLLTEAVGRRAIPPSDELSFPSGHAMAPLAAGLALALLVPPGRPRTLTLIAAVGITALNGVAIVFLWWHYPSDVVGGWCLALAWVAALALIVRPGRSAPGRSSRKRAPTHATARHQPASTSEG